MLYPPTFFILLTTSSAASYVSIPIGTLRARDSTRCAACFCAARSSRGRCHPIPHTPMEIGAFKPKKFCGDIHTGFIVESGEAAAARSRMSASDTRAATPLAVIATVKEAKDSLRRALEASGGSTLAEDVISAVEVLSRFNPTPSPARAWSINSGTWVSIGQDFVGTTRTADGLECTLGRLTFNVFEPVKLPILITDTSQTVGQREENVDPTEETLYTICTQWVARDGSGLKGRVEVRGSCWEDPSKPDRVMIRFSSGELKPGEGQDLGAWGKVVGVRGMTGAGGDDSEGEQPSLLATMKDMATKLMMKVMFGFEGPSETVGFDGELRYTMKRSPKGFHDILFLDDEMRVTRGHRGGLVVVTRST